MLDKISNLFRKQPVNTLEEALILAQEKIQKKFPGDYTNYDHSMLYDSKRELWRFRYLNKPNMNGVCVLSGIGPGVEIRKSDGKIKYLDAHQ